MLRPVSNPYIKAQMAIIAVMFGVIVASACNVDSNYTEKGNREVKAKNIIKQLTAMGGNETAADQKSKALIVDELMGIDSVTEIKAVRGYYTNMFNKAIEKIKTVNVANECAVLKMIGQGYMVKTKNQIVAFNLISGNEYIQMDNRAMDNLSESVDVLIIDNTIEERSDYRLAEMISQKKKPVVVLGDYWSSKPYSNGLTRIFSYGQGFDRVGDIEFKIIARKRGGVHLERVLLIKSGEKNIVHIGYQLDEKNIEEMVNKLGSENIDIMLLSRMQENLDEIIAKTKPEMILIGDEHEVGRSKDVDESYGSIMNKIDGRDNISVITWGEVFNKL